MTTPPIAARPVPQTHTQEKFAFDKATSGDVTFLTMYGTLDHAFEGKKVADAIHTKKVIVSLRHVRRFASWGMSEWMDFLRINAAREMYLVECSTYAMSQINLVTGLMGHAKLVSFYASYRCGSCSEEHENLFLIPRDRSAIRDLPNSHQECATCGGRTRLEEYPAAFFDTIADRPTFDIDDEVLGFFRTQFQYPLAPDLTRFRAYRKLHKGYTYLRLSGNIATLPSDLLASASEGTAVVDLESILFDPTDPTEEVTPWRAYVQRALDKVKSLQLFHCPVGFLESGVALEDLRNKLKVRTFAIPYDCMLCETTTAHMIDVAENLEQLAGGIPPTMLCATCRSQLIARLTPEQVMIMRSLPARDRDPVLDKFLVAARAEPIKKLENCLVPLAPKLPKAQTGTRRLIYTALALAVLISGGLAVVAVGLWKQPRDTTPIVAAQNSANLKPPPPTFERPAWILSDVPSTAYCHDMINRLMCVGVSSYRATRDEAVAEANDAALEELVSVIGLKIGEPFFKESVIAGYNDARSKTLSVLQAADPDQASAAYTKANAAVTKARKRVAEILRSSGGPAVPTQRADWYWEEYAAKKGGTETLVFVRYDVTLEAVKLIVERYSAQTQVLGSSVMTAFPALAWQYADFTGGVIVTKLAHPLADTGIALRDVILAVGDQRVSEASNFAHRLDEWKQGTEDLKLMVKTGDNPTRVVDLVPQKTK